MALAHPFLMRGILAVSALHLGQTMPEKKLHYLAIAAYHQNLALPSYRYLVENLEHRMDKGNAPAIIAFGRLTIAYAFFIPTSSRKYSLRQAMFFNWRAGVTFPPSWRLGSFCNAQSFGQQD
jgi:hypothetical protein